MTVTDTGLGTVWGTTAAGQTYLTALATDWFIPEVQDTRNNACPILGLIPEKSVDVGGKFIRIPVIWGRNYSAFNYVREKGKMPDPGTIQAWQYAFRPRKMFLRLVADGDLIDATEPDAARYIEYYEFMQKPVQDDMAVDHGRILHNDGSGRIAEVDANQGGVATDSVALRLNSSWESVATCSSSPTGPGSSGNSLGEYLPTGTRVSFYSNAGILRGTRTVLAMTSEALGPPSRCVVQFTSTVTGMSLQTGDWLLRSSRDDVADGAGGSAATGEALSSAYRVEPMGLRGIFTTSGTLDGNGLIAGAGTYDLAAADDFTSTSGTGFQGLPVSGTISGTSIAIPQFNRAPVFNNGGGLRVPSEEYLKLVKSAVEDRNGAKINMMLSHSSVHDAYGNSLTADKRYVNTLSLNGGWEVADFSGIPWYRDRQCHRNICYMLALDSAGFAQYVQTPFKPVMAYGQQWYRLPDDEIYHAAWKMTMNIGVGCRDRAGALITDLLGAVA